MNESEQSTPVDVRNIVREILRSDEFCSQLRCSIERAASINGVSQINSPVTSSRIPVASPAEELRRLFPSTRGLNTGNRSFPTRVEVNRTFQSSKKRKRGQKMLLPDFTRDVLLLRNPEVTKTLTGIQKSSAYENGYAVSAAVFQRSWTEREIFAYIENLFSQKLQGIKFEILIPICGTLVKPNLPEGTVLDGTTMCRLFTQKNIYVRPFSEIDIDCKENEFEEYSNSTFENEFNENHIPVPLPSTPHTDSTENNIEIINNQLSDSENNLSTIQVTNENNVIDEIFEHDTTLAIRKSLEVEKNENMTDILQQLHNKIDVGTISQFNIYREDIFNCCLRALRRKNFSPLNRISVMFTDIDNNSEGAVDLGGPTKEMFRLLLKYLQNSTLFEGSEHCKNITLLNEHLESEHYYEAGRIIALSLLHGGPSPQFLSETLFDYLVSGVSNTKPRLDEIMNTEIRTELEAIRDAPGLPELQLAIWNSTFMAIAGFGNVNNFDKKNTILESAIKYYLIYRCTPALEQFKNGLNTLGLLDNLKIFGNEFKKLMCYTNSELTAEKVSAIFTVKFSETGSNSRNIENRIFTFWNDFLLDCQEKETEATLEDVLCFATACEKVPPLGFESQPKLEFLHNEEFLWPKANTCIPILYLPISYERNEYEKFRSNMNYAILNGMQFGFA